MTQLDLIPEPTRQCPRCEGRGTFRYTFDQGDLPERKCYACDGAGSFPPVAESIIRAAVINPKTGKLWSTSFHSKAGRKRAAGLFPRDVRRAQYVWRTALFNSGMDRRGFNLGGAIMAGMDLGADPFKPELDKLADAIADECYGKGANMRAAARWNKALHGY